MGVIQQVLAWEALDSRGQPTVACMVRLDSGAEGEALAPAGASTGSHEAVERRDTEATRYAGRGVRAAVELLHAEISPLLVGREVDAQEELDAALRALDGTEDLSRLGANTVLAASVACALAAAANRGVALWRALAPEGPPLLPLPMVNVLSGGAHAGRMIDVQDFLVVPVGAKSFAEALEWAVRVRAATSDVLSSAGYEVALVADEGGLAAPLPTNRAALDVLLAGIERSGLAPGSDVAIAVDVAATQLVADGGYVFPRERRSLQADELVEELAAWVDDFPIVSIEDPLGEDDAEGWKLVTHRLGGRVQLVGDDLFATSVARLRRGIADRAANAVLVKPNQVGTLSDARAVVELARDAGYATVLSARSGETEQAWLADLAIAWQAGQLKVGSTMRSERTAKWNRLLRIEAEDPNAVFAGRDALVPRPT